MKYSTVVVAACIGGASLATAVRPGSTSSSQAKTPSIQKPSLLSNTEHIDHSHPSSAGEPVALPRLVSSRLHKVKGPQRLPKHYEEESAPANKVMSSMTPDVKHTTAGATLTEAGSHAHTGGSLPSSPPPLPSDDALNMEARGLDVDDLEARTFDDVERLLGRNFLDNVKANYHARKETYYEKKANKEKALAGINTPSPSAGEVPVGEVQDPTASLPSDVAARGYDDAELRTRDLIQSWNAAADTILHKKPIVSLPVLARDSLVSDELEARGHDDAELDARDNIFEQIGRGVGAVMDTFKGKTPASSRSHSVSPMPPTDSSIAATDSSMGEGAPVMARNIVDQESIDSRDLEEDSLNSRDLGEMELFERDLSEELVARGYDVEDLKARNLFTSALNKIFSHKKATPSVHPDHSMFLSSHHSMVPSSDHSSMYADSYAAGNAPIVQRDFVDHEHLDSRDYEEDHLESRDLHALDLLERSIREELVARGYDDGDLAARSILSRGLKKIVSSKILSDGKNVLSGRKISGGRKISAKKILSGQKLSGAVHLSMATPSGHSLKSTYSYANNPTIVQPADRESFNSGYEEDHDPRDLDERNFEEELYTRGFDIDELD